MEDFGPSLLPKCCVIKKQPFICYMFPNGGQYNAAFATDSTKCALSLPISLLFFIIVCHLFVNKEQLITHCFPIVQLQDKISLPVSSLKHQVFFMNINLHYVSTSYST